MECLRSKFIALLTIVVLMLVMSITTTWAQNPASNSSAKADYATAMAEYQKIHIRPSMMECLNKADASTYLDRQCYQVESTYQNKRINEAYKLLMAQLDANDKVKLRDEEREWIKHRDSECVISQGDVGQSGILDHDECLISETAKRATELESRLSKSK